jgi:hypothetical protein
LKVNRRSPDSARGSVVCSGNRRTLLIGELGSMASLAMREDDLIALHRHHRRSIEVASTS